MRPLAWTHTVRDGGLGLVSHHCLEYSLHRACPASLPWSSGSSQGCCSCQEFSWHLISCAGTSAIRGGAWLTSCYLGMPYGSSRATFCLASPMYSVQGEATTCTCLVVTGLWDLRGIVSASFDTSRDQVFWHGNRTMNQFFH